MLAHCDTLFCDILELVVNKYLKIPISYLGAIPLDNQLAEAVMQQKPVSLSYPNAKATIAYEEIAFTSKDISSLEFALNGQVLMFPTTVKELEGAGYTLDVPYQNEVLQGSNGTVYCAVYCSARNGEGSMIRFSACNLSKESKPIEECEIENISAEDALFILCNGVSLESSYEEVIAIMGEPDEYEEEGNAKKLTYMIADGYSIYIRYMNGNYEEMETLRLSDRTH